MCIFRNRFKQFKCSLLFSILILRELAFGSICTRPRSLFILNFNNNDTNEMTLVVKIADVNVYCLKIPVVFVQASGT